MLMYLSITIILYVFLFAFSDPENFQIQVTANLMSFVIKAEIRHYAIVKNDYIQIMLGLSARA